MTFDRRAFRRVVRFTLVPVIALLGVQIGIQSGTATVSAQEIDMDAAQAAEEFRWGVYAYHAGRFNDAVVAFTRAISFKPDDLRAREWLGRAYYRSGFVDAALSEWDVVVDAGAGGAYLRSRLEQIRYRRGVLPLLEEDIRLSRSQRVFGRQGERMLFQRPAGLAVEPTGDIFLVSLGTQEVLRITPNGRIRSRIRGGLEGLDAPFDVAWRDGTLYVTEFGRDRISVFDDTGGRRAVIGESGLTEGRLLGPQYIAVDEAGFIYTTEWGARRVSKFAPDGTFALSFGGETAFFPGLQRPTGIAVRNGAVYVADVTAEGPVIHRFDESGNFLEEIPLPLTGEDAPDHAILGTVVEDLGWYDEDRLLVSAGTRVLLFDPDRQAVEAVMNDEERVRVASAARDANHRVVVSDFDAGDFAIFEPEGTLYAGLDVQVERILARNFPEIGVLVAVHDRNGRPIVGLETQNFIISENGRPQNGAVLDSSGQSVTTLDTVAVVQPRAGQRYTEDAGRAIADLAATIPANDSLDLYIAGREPLLISQRPAGPDLYADRTARAMVERADLFAADDVALDRSIRVAASELVDAGIRRNIVLVGDGRTGDAAFNEYTVEELAAFLVNNGIRFHIVLLEQRSPDSQLSYLVEESGGTVRYVYEPEGIAPLVADFRTEPIGRYWLRYTSTANADFGRAFIELSAEAQIFVRSGRDEMGYFSPSDS